MILEIADCELAHKLDTLIAALRVFRTDVEEEFGPHERRERELKELKEE